ncbi:MAG TPA: O-antigen ligase family protein [Dissulfurispiraceae bacterium]
MDRVVLSGLICLGMFLIAVRKGDWIGTIKENSWLFLLVAYMLASSLWSEVPYISFKRWTRELGTIVMALLILTERDPRRAVQSVIRRSVYLLVPFSLLLIKYFPEYGVDFNRWTGERMWVGVTLQKNGLGRLCLISIFYLFWTLIVRRRRRVTPVSRFQTHAEVLVLLIALFLLKGPPGVYPATAVVALCAGIAAFLFLKRMEKRHISLGATTLTVMIALLIVFGCATVIAGGSTVSEFSPVVGRSETLTGRTDIWARLLPFFEKSPFLGYGFGSFWAPVIQEHVFGLKEAHNGYLDVSLGLGVVGLFLTSMFLLSFARKAQRVLTYDHDWASLCICYLLMALIHNIAESSFDSFVRHFMSVLLFLSVTLPKGRKAKQHAPLKNRNGKFPSPAGVSMATEISSPAVRE